MYLPFTVEASATQIFDLLGLCSSFFLAVLFCFFILFLGWSEFFLITRDNTTNTNMADLSNGLGLAARNKREASEASRVLFLASCSLIKFCMEIFVRCYGNY